MYQLSEITFSGVGGQGLVSAGNILCLAAITYAGKYATMMSEYGTETRGTFAKSDIIISDEPILYPQIECPKVVLCLSPIAYEKYRNLENPEMIVIYDSDSIQADENKPFKQVGFPFSTTAIENDHIPVNMLSLGFLTAMTNCIDAECVEHAIEKTYASKKSVLEKNLRAFRIGYANSCKNNDSDKDLRVTELII